MGKEARELRKKILEYTETKGYKLSRIDNSPKMRYKNAVEKGTPDLLGITNKGRGLAIELKTENDTQSDDQKEYEYEFTKRGGIYVLVGSVDDLIKAGL